MTDLGEDRRGHGNRSAAERATQWLLFAAAVALAAWLRLQDVLRSHVIGAEDPYTHMALVRLHVRYGHLTSAHIPGFPYYPPGFHAFVGAAWASAGLDLYAFTRFAPVLLGVLAVAGAFFLARWAMGPVAGVVAATLAAAMPEMVFRTALLFPTALDLALLPWALLALVGLARGDGRHGILLAVVGLALVLAHPWLGPLLGAMGGVLLVLTVAHRLPAWLAGAPWRREALGAAGAGAILAGLGAFTYVYWWNREFIGLWRFGDTLAETSLASHLPMVAVAVGAAVVLVTFAAVVGARLPTGDHRFQVAAFAAAGVALAAAWPTVAERMNHLPAKVNFVHMLGWPAIVLALVGLVAVAARRRPGALVGVAVVVVTLPFTTLPVFQEWAWYLPHRTVAYLAVGVALLGGWGAQVLSDAARAAVAAGPGAVGRRGAWGGAAALAVVGAVVLATAAPAGAGAYQWYRYYDEDQFAAVEEVACLAAEPGGVEVVTFAWQPALFVRALGAPESVQWWPGVFLDPAERERRIDELNARGWAGVVLVDPHLRDLVAEEGGDLGFLQDTARYEPIVESDDGSVRAYLVRDTGHSFDASKLQRCGG